MLAFGRRARTKQAEFRNHSPTISAAARSPSDEKGERNPHLLAIGHEDENLYPPLRASCKARSFFTERDIKWWKSCRSGDEMEVTGPTRNMASSQVACVNFLLPLASIPGALAEVLRCFDSDVANVVPMEYEGLSSTVEFEWIGREGSLEGGQRTRGANVTSADALIVGATAGGARRAYLFEWKYVEEYQVGRWLGMGKSGETRRGRYKPLLEASDSPLRPGVSLDDLLYEPFFQLLRLLLLGRRIIRDAEFQTSGARAVVVCPQENLAYRNRITSPPLAKQLSEVRTVHEVMKQLMNTPSELVFSSQEELLQRLRASAPVGLSDWLTYQEARYGW